MLRVRLLGGLEVDAGVAGAGVPAGRPARLVLGWLAAFPGEHARAEVAARLWPDVLDSSARASLRTALSELRGALGPAAVHVRATRETVALGGEGLWVDLRAFSELIACGPARGGARALPRRGAGGARRGVGARAALAACGRASGGGGGAGARGEGGGGCRLGAGVGPPAGRVGSAGRGGRARADAGAGGGGRSGGRVALLC